MSTYPTSNTPIKTIGFSEFCEVNGRQFKRRKGVQQWTEVSQQGGLKESTELSPLRLSLVQQEQAPGEPLHWSLFVAREGQAGMVYQVKGDAEFMTYQPSNRAVDITASTSFINMYNLATVTEQQAVTENCQGWVVRVIAKLVGRDVVGNSKLEMASSMVQRIR
ncbi:hypothetical protein AJ79_07751 [Helicocarpus griseus UAMH5409]|uniref:Uncharacterized protein n=1 Tax=Helicocarpus griseus UAMH5409 TaxID=1447875 RepID=A0A2B7WZM1_9EURO|nr:hypothetical protein AJ79_07751 [Helicocarpus griseus UAMH5409]